MRTMQNDSRQPIEVVHNGAGRAARFRLQPLADINRISTSVRFDPTWVDPALGKGRGLVEDGNALGLNGSFVETTGQDYAKTLESDSRTVSVTAIDDAASLPELVRLNQERPHFIQFFLDFPGYGPTAWAFLLGRNEKEAQSTAIRFFQALPGIVARGGTSDVFGPPAASATRHLEPRFRVFLDDHFKKNIGKVLHGLEPEVSPIVMSFDGKITSQVVVLEPGDDWRNAAQLLDEVKSSLQVPVRPGIDFTIVEVGHEEMRIHRARYKISDRQFALEGRDYATISTPEEESIPVRPLSALSKLTAALLAD